MIDLKRFFRLKDKGLCWVEKSDTEGTYVVKFKRFDNETGTELPSEYQYFKVADLENDAIDLQNQLIAIEFILGLVKNIA
jgi:hypothetical protein